MLFMLFKLKLTRNYMNENSIKKNKNFENLRTKLTAVIEELSQFISTRKKIAAE